MEHIEGRRCVAWPTYVYRLFDSSNCLLYVGCTLSLRDRLDHHRYNKPWWSEVASVEALQFDCACFAADHEAWEIDTRLPKYANRVLKGTAWHINRHRLRSLKSAK